MMTNPLMMYCQMSETPTRMSPLESTAMIRRADQRAPDRADAADETGAAENDRRDGVEFVGLSKLQPVGRVEPGRRHDAAKAGQKARNAVDEEQHQRHLDAGQPRCLGIAADGVDPGAEHGALEHQPGQHHDRQSDDDQPGNAEQRTVADEVERQVRS